MPEKKLIDTLKDVEDDKVRNDKLHEGTPRETLLPLNPLLRLAVLLALTGE